MMGKRRKKQRLKRKRKLRTEGEKIERKTNKLKQILSKYYYKSDVTKPKSLNDKINIIYNCIGGKFDHNNFINYYY